MSSYSAMQFLFAPILGRLSDRFGRRPVLLISLLGTVAGYLVFAFARSLGALFVARLLDGATGGTHVAEPTPENGQPPGCSAAPPLTGWRLAGRLDKCRRPGGRVTVRFSLAAVRRTGDHAVAQTRV